MNIINMFWAFIAEVAGLIITLMMWTLVNPLIGALVAPGSSMYYISMLGLVIMTIILVIVVPLMTAMSDEDGGAFKRIITAR